jgi:hypothetical protein
MLSDHRPWGICDRRQATQCRRTIGEEAGSIVRFANGVQADHTCREGGASRVGSREEPSEDLSVRR